MLFGEQDLYLFREGTHRRLYEKLGAHLTTRDGVSGCRFAVWAPNASRVSLIGEFNGWNAEATPLELDPESGVHEVFVPGIEAGATYKYRVVSRLDGYDVDKTDPFAFFRERPPGAASMVWDLAYEWSDDAWTAEGRKRAMARDAPWSIYEVHLGSWKRNHDGESLTYRELADALVPYVVEMGFTHVELLPVMEHPYYPSWGYQTTGYFAPTSRYGTPQDFMALVDRFHGAGIGVLLDWVPSHFPSDAHGLGYFDGTYLYEHADPRQRIHPDWDSLEFNYGRGQVSSFLLSGAAFWLERYHADGFRVDAVASMLYLDYSRDEGQWVANRYGGRENLEAIEFLRRLNGQIYSNFPDVQTVAEESTSWPLVTRPADAGGLGFGLKWDMGFMHDVLAYFKERPEHRRFHQNKITFRLMYAYSENFVLPFSHDEVVHGKGSLLTRMPGDDWQQFANARLLLGYTWGQPGKKLVFMGAELGQRTEWNHDEALEWFVLEHPYHAGIKRWLSDLNHLYRDTPALYAEDFAPHGFDWVNCENDGKSVLSFLRRDASEALVLAVFNFSTTVYHGHRLGVPRAGAWRELLNSDAEHYGGSGQGNLGAVDTENVPFDGYEQSLSLTVPALAAVFLAPDGEANLE